MANEKQEIVLEIQVQGSIDNLAKLRSEMDALIKTRQDLSAKSKEGDIEATKEIEKLNSAVRNMQTEYKAQQRVLDGYNASVKTNVNTSNLAANSIQQNRDLLKQLTAQYIQLKAPSENATSQIKHLSDVLKEQESAIGNNTRNVGNYKEAFSSAFSSVTSAIPALKGFKTAQLGVNAAMDANPIGAVVLLLSSLFEIFSKNKAIADQITFAIAGLEKGFGSIIDTIVDTVTNFDKLTDAIAHPLDFIWNLGKGAAQAAKEGYNASKAFDELIVANAKLNAEIGVGQERADALTKSLKDRTKSEKERIAIANQIADLEVSNAKKLSNLRQKELDALNMQNKDRTLSGEEQAKVIEKQGQVDIAALQATTAESQRQTRINILLDKQAAENKIDVAKQLQDDLNKLRLENAKNLDDERKKNGEKEKTDAEKIFNEQNSFLQKQLDLDLGYADLEVASKEEKEKRKQQILINSLEKQLDLAIQFLGADGDITKAEIQGIEAIRLKLKQAKADAAKPTPETYFESLGINQEALGNAEKTLQGFAQIVSSINDIVTKGFQIRENEIESQKNHEIEAVQSSTLAQKEKDAKIREINKQAAQEKYQLELQAFNTSKGIQIVQAIISTALAVVNGLNAGLSLGPAGLVMGPVLAALAGVTGAVQIALIASQQPPPPPQFAKGIIGLDGEGTETSDSIDARLSKGESVMTAKATRRFHRELAYMEMSVGNSPNYQIGRGKFASGFIPSPNVVTSDGGFAARDIARNADNSALIQNAIKNGFALAPAPVLSIVEFQTKQNDRNRSVNISEA